MDFLARDDFGHVLARGGVEIDEAERGDSVVALASWDEDPLVGAAAGDAVDALLDIVLDLRVVDLEDRGKVGLGGVDKHEIAVAFDRDTVGDSLVGFHLVDGASASGVETADSAGEAIGGGGQGSDVDVDAVGAQRTLYSLTGVEERVVEEVPDAACTAALLLHHSEDVEV